MAVQRMCGKGSRQARNDVAASVQRVPVAAYNAQPSPFDYVTGAKAGMAMEVARQKCRPRHVHFVVLREWAKKDGAACACLSLMRTACRTA